MKVTDEMVNAARSAYSVDRIPNGEIINKIAGPGYGDKLIRGIIEAALSHAAGQDGEQCRAALGEDAYVIEQMGRLLAEIAVIVNGPEPPMTRWSYHDLPEKVRALSRGVPEGM